jgi:RNA polymerase sigma factor (sigma-70 family)
LDPTAEETDLVRAAQAGDVTALGLLLARHEAGMRAVALSLLGHRPEVDDAVQDAMVLAVRRIGEVREPAAVGGWLRTIVRNNCRMWLRAVRPVSVADPEWFAPPASDPGPEEVMDRGALRDWVWHAVGQLSEADRLVTLLRYFSDVPTYEQIAALCGVPVGTVRSRLSHARRKLTDSLRMTADAAHDDATAAADVRWAEGRDVLASAMRGDFRRVVWDGWWPDAEMVAPGGIRGDRSFAVRGMDADLAHGVRQRLVNVVASGGLLIWETELISPAHDPTHCPPSAVWLHALRQGRVQRLTLFHPEATGK